MINIFKNNFFLIVAAAIIFRLFISLLPPFEVDQNVWRAWSLRLAEIGPANFYSPTYFTDYTPGFLYIYLLLGLVKVNLLSALPFNAPFFDFLLKIPANVADIAVGLLIYQIIKKRLSKVWAILGFCLYVFNPAIFFNSSIWGQFDGASTLILLLSLIFFLKKRPELSSLFFAIAWTMKPQAVAFAPVLGLLFITNLKFKRWLTSFFVFIATILVIYIPFFPKNPIGGVIYVFNTITNVYNCSTCFAFNFWGMLGNWRQDSLNFMGTSYLIWGILLTLLSFVPIFFIGPLKKRLEPPFIYLTTAITFYSFFIFLTRMHERYLFPFFAFFLIGSLLLKSRLLLFYYLLISLLSFLNLYLPYVYYNNHQVLTSSFDIHLQNNFELLSFISSALLISLIALFLNIMNKTHEN